MRKSSRIELQTYMQDLREQLARQRNQLSQIENNVSKKLKMRCHSNGRNYYFIRDTPGEKYIYAGKSSNPKVRSIQEAHFLHRSVCELEREIRIIEKMLEQSRYEGYESVDRMLSPAYRGAVPTAIDQASAAVEWKRSMEAYKKTFPPFRPEELIHKTRDGTYVRSKGEALIYNYLLDIGVVFVYELPLRIRLGSKNSLLLPDFTLLSEIDYKTVIYIEHQGMMSTPKYREKFNDSVYKYWLNGYLPERDVFFTFDLPNGGFDDRPISNIIRHSVRPYNTK